MQYPQVVLEALSEDLELALQTGYACISRGSLVAARDVFSGLTRPSLKSGEAQQVGRGLIRIGDELMDLADFPGALVAYLAGLEIRLALTEQDPGNTEWQRDLSIGHDKIGDVLQVQGRRSEALVAYRKGLEIAEMLVQRNPEHTLWQEDLSVSCDQVGTVLMAQDDFAGALAYFRAGLAIAESLAQRDPNNMEWQRDLSISHNKIGDALLAQGDSRGALASYHAALEIRKALTQRDPENTQWQLDVLFSQGHVGDTLEGQGESRKARAAYSAALEIAEVLARQDSQSVQRQLDIAYFCAKLASLDCLMTTKMRRQYLAQGREALFSLNSKKQLAEVEDWIEHFDVALKLVSWLPWNAARTGLKIIGIGLLAIHILQSPFIVEPGWVAIHLAIVFSFSLFFGVVLSLVNDRASGAEKTDYQAVTGQLVAAVKRHPIRLALLLPGEDGVFFVPLLWVGITPFTAGIAAAAFAAVHYPEYPIITCVPKFVVLYGVAMVVLPHGIGSVVVGHLLADAVVFLLLMLSGDD